MSRLDVVVGPKGAGKTTYFERIVAPVRPGLPFVNADRIAREHFAGQELERSYDAARIAERARTALIDARLDFCAETIFSHPSKVDFVTEAIDAGYDVVLHVLMIPFELSAPRVAARVLSGGHDVPLDRLAARYERIWPLVASVVPLCRRVVFLDNSADDGPFEVASFRLGVADHGPRWPTWTPAVLTQL